MQVPKIANAKKCKCKTVLENKLTLSLSKTFHKSPALTLTYPQNANANENKCFDFDLNALELSQAFPSSLLLSQFAYKCVAWLTRPLLGSQCRYCATTL